MWLRLNCLIVLMTLCRLISAGDIERKENFVFHGTIDGAKNISGVAQVNGMLAIASDEGATLDLLKMAAAGDYRLLQSVPLLKHDGDKHVEIDMEGLAADGDSLYVVGSHSLTRKQVDTDDDYEKNRKSLAKVSHEEDREDRDKLFRLKINSDGTLDGKKSISLRELLTNDRILGPFCKIPSKENGIDIEGIAISEDQLFVGFRGPVLRENHVPVMVFRFEAPQDYELRFINLDGRGIRDITRVNGGFLVIGGPVGDGDATYRMYLWNGIDGIPGVGHPAAQLAMLGEIPTKPKSKAEGVTVLQESEQHYRVLVVFDGPENGDPTVFNIPKP